MYILSIGLNGFSTRNFNMQIIAYDHPQLHLDYSILKCWLEDWMRRRMIGFENVWIEHEVVTRPSSKIEK